MIWLRILSALLLVASVVVPRVLAPGQETPPTAADVVLVVDRTTSMGAQDYQAGHPRVDGVAADIEAIAAALPNARYSVVTADNEARIAAPWTSDSAAVVTLGKTMGWREEGYGTGSDISAGAPLAQELLESSQTARPDAARYLFYFGDGEQIADGEPGSFEGMRELLDAAWVLGYGTNEGGVMALRVDSDELVTRNGTPQRSMIDEARLQTIAQQLDGTYLHRTGPGGLELPTAPSVTVAETSGQPQQQFPFGVLLAAAAAIALGADIALTARKTRKLREEVHP